jgi:hypothetical protein
MPKFDFITSKDFRDSLEADETELRAAYEARAWKSVLVLSGSIVEALLIDYLLATTNPARSKKDPLRLDLAEAIDICRAENALSQRSADLCSVIRSYRNLIHPGRSVRLSEPAPNKDTAAVALALAEMITDEQARVRREAVGLTGEQLLSKIKKDANSLTILKHLLREVTPAHRERLLLELIPAAYMETSGDSFFDGSESGSAQRLQKAFESIFDEAPPELKTKVAMQFVKVLREGEGEHVIAYGTAFFRASYLQFIPEPNRAMVIEHLLSQASGTHTPESLHRINGIEKFLLPAHADKWLDPFVRTQLRAGMREKEKKSARSHFVFSLNDLPEMTLKKAEKRFAAWIAHYEREEDTNATEQLRTMLKEAKDNDIPF